MAVVKKAALDVENYQFLECRDIRHHWMPHDAALDAGGQAVHRILRCANCATRRLSTISIKKGATYGKVLSNSYSYPKGYQVKGGLGVENMARIRVHNVLLEIREREE